MSVAGRGTMAYRAIFEYIGISMIRARSSTRDFSIFLHIANYLRVPRYRNVMNDTINRKMTLKYKMHWQHINLFECAHIKYHIPQWHFVFSETA